MREETIGLAVAEMFKIEQWGKVEMTIEEALPFASEVSVGWWSTLCCNLDAEEIVTPEDADLIRNEIEAQRPDYDREIMVNYVWRSEAEMKEDPVYQEWLKS
jgi:hypothetical protein